MEAGERCEKRLQSGREGMVEAEAEADRSSEGVGGRRMTGRSDARWD
jgi:hypothetical protein